MIKVIAEDFIKEEYLEIVKPLYAELVAKTKLEKDCIEYNLYIDQDDKTHFIFIEEWPDHEALDRHCQTKHFRRLVPLINKHQAKECEFTIMDIFQ
ncbi:antibiotic biosynthesis monooxygenase [Dysgonomonas mossii]|uniref:Antibiotic biosynthesis monooxygenase n=1 Tax=Dysgonomonas mossii TaxID=163665 RepID=A0A4Y9IM50_9BACT|nr:putative quinol monooxygenase [Dysgonomonas mossii]MBF0761971.1 antibiotic biosynthesis monooxygenase [Dysgonomonas mossii]TFU88795.1 antibiotic biosynthesis monooxygenase [Dysgonomonas mossii]